MADGTTGLGQPTTVFDFSGIAQLGLQIDQINEQRAQKRSAKFEASNKDIMDTQGISLGKVRDVDRAYLQKKLNEFQDLAAQAYRTEDPAIAQQARALKSQIAERVSVSATLQSNDFAESAKFAEAEDRGYYINQLNQHRQSTAMTDENDGLIDPVAVKYTFVPERDLIKGNLADATATYVGAVKETATTTTAEGTTRTSRDRVLSEANKKYDVFSQTAEGKLYVKEAYFQDKFGIERFKESDTVRMEEMIAASEQLHTQFDNVEQIQEAYKNDKARAREMTELFNLKNDMDDWGRNKFVTELEARIGYADRQAKKAEGPSKYEELRGKMALSSGKSLSEAVANFEVTEDSVPEGFDATKAVGYASVPNMGLKASAKGEFNKVFQGVVHSDGEEYAIIAEPSDNFIQEINALKEAGITGEAFQAKALELLSKDNYETRMVPIAQAQSLVQSEFLSASRTAAKEKYDQLFEKAAGAI